MIIPIWHDIKELMYPMSLRERTIMMSETLKLNWDYFESIIIMHNYTQYRLSKSRGIFSLRKRDNTQCLWIHNAWYTCKPQLFEHKYQNILGAQISIPNPANALLLNTALNSQAINFLQKKCLIFTPFQTYLGCDYIDYNILEDSFKLQGNLLPACQDKHISLEYVFWQAPRRGIGIIKAIFF